MARVGQKTDGFGTSGDVIRLFKRSPCLQQIDGVARIIAANDSEVNLRAKITTATVPRDGALVPTR